MPMDHKECGEGKGMIALLYVYFHSAYQGLSGVITYRRDTELPLSLILALFASRSQGMSVRVCAKGKTADSV